MIRFKETDSDCVLFTPHLNAVFLVFATKAQRGTLSLKIFRRLALVHPLPAEICIYMTGGRFPAGGKRYGFVLAH